MSYNRHPISLFHDFGLLGNLFNEANRTYEKSRASSGYPKVNAYSNENTLALTAEIPGVDPKTIDISVEGNKLGIAGDIPSRVKGENESYHRGERFIGKFQRELTLPFNVDVSSASASYLNGILTLNLARREEDKPKKIEVKVS